MQALPLNILMISPFVPYPPNSGGKVRVFNILNHLRNGHRVSFVAASFGGADAPRHADDHIVRLPAPGRLRQVQALLSPDPYHVALVRDQHINACVRRLLSKNRYDLIYLHYLYAIQYLPIGLETPVVLDPQNVDRDLWSRKWDNRANPLPIRLYSWLNAQKTVRFETRNLGRIRAYVSISRRDRAGAQRYAGRRVSKFLIAPNGVDTAVFSPKPCSAAARKVVLGFMGSMDLAINQQAALELCLEILPRLRRSLPGWEIGVLLVGKNPPPKIVRLGADDPRIRVTGTVDDVVSRLHQMDVMVLPLREGAGAKLRVLEAMSTGLPVVGTRLAFIGLDGLKQDHNFCRAESPEGMVAILSKLARDPAKRDEIGRNARKLVVARYDWQKVVAQLGEQLQSLATPG